MVMLKNKILNIVAAILMPAANAANVLPTPGSSAGYLYFPAASSGTSGTGGSGGATVTECYLGMTTKDPMPCSVGDPVYASSTDKTIVGKYAGNLSYASRHIISSLTQVTRSFGCDSHGLNYGTDTGNGMDNTNKSKTCGQASQYCASLGSDWYLPAKDELNVMYQNKLVIGGFSNTNYWSSTEEAREMAFSQNFSNGTQSKWEKYNTFAVRCARIF